MALIKLELDYPIENGMSVTFQAPCDCTAVTGIKVYYPSVTDDAITTVNKTFTFRDCHLNNLNGLGHLFMAGAYVKAVLDVDNAYAFLQNADTNGLLEQKLNDKIFVTKINVPIEAWTDSLVNENYLFEATMTVDGATENMRPEVCFNFEDAVSSNYAPVANSLMNGVTIYAKELPTAMITVESVTLWK